METEDSINLKANIKKLVVANSLMGLAIIGMSIVLVVLTTGKSTTEVPSSWTDGDQHYKNDYPLEYKFELHSKDRNV